MPRYNHLLNLCFYKINSIYTVSPTVIDRMFKIGETSKNRAQSRFKNDLSIIVFHLYILISSVYSKKKNTHPSEITISKIELGYEFYNISRFE